MKKERIQENATTQYLANEMEAYMVAARFFVLFTSFFVTVLVFTLYLKLLNITIELYPADKVHIFGSMVVDYFC